MVVSPLLVFMSSGVDQGGVLCKIRESSAECTSFAFCPQANDLRFWDFCFYQSKEMTQQDV